MKPWMFLAVGLLLLACPEVMRRPDPNPGVADSALTNCSPRVTDGGPVELCNGADEDCDRIPDEGYALGLPCEGSCPNSATYTGRTVCATDQISTVCEPSAGWEVCTR